SDPSTPRPLNPSTPPKVRVADHAPLAPLTTLRLGGAAARLVTVETDDEVVECVREIDARGDALLVLGGGSNLVISDAGFHGTVVRMGTRGRTSVVHAASERVHVTAHAGEPWDDSETIVAVRAYDRDRREVVVIPHEACAFSYRSSVFRGKDRHVILDVTFALERTGASRPIRYAELARALDVAEGKSAPLAAVRETVVALRRKKGMVLDPSDPDTTSAGSFFTNPILSAQELAQLEARASGEGRMPVFPERDGRFKVSAGWLIERAGFAKGFLGAEGRTAVSSKHALALTNRSRATTADLIALARQIRDGVRGRFGVTLENEPVFIGVRL
ncbi:MAG: UDP-N-acetylenolpyruvoylglucosamine reductase, partial [Labilithrix sp.]|nr:UDP-N-acetylenolpyruvoylglucosamine reductase [Labilithrix sp.]